MPTACSESCVGRIRYLGVMLYDADRIEAAASVEDPQDLYQSQLDVFLDPNDPEVIKKALEQGIDEEWIKAAQRSPVYKMAMEWKIAFPLHPEYRTLPMVWYVPPLSPIQGAMNKGQVKRDSGGILPNLEDLRIPVRYLANLLTAGKVEPIEKALKTMIAMRQFKREETVHQRKRPEILKEIGLSPEQIEDMYQLMAIANYEDRFVIPTSHKEQAQYAFDEKASCGFSFGNGCSDGASDASLFGKRKTSPIIFHDLRSQLKEHRLTREKVEED